MVSNTLLQSLVQSKSNLERGKGHLEEANAQLTAECKELSSRKTEAERKIKLLENQVGEANVRLADDEQQVTELQNTKGKMQKELEMATAQLEEVDSRCSTLDRAKKSLESQLAQVQVCAWGPRRFDNGKLHTVASRFFWRKGLGEE